MMSAMSGVQLKNRKRSVDLILIIGLNEPIDKVGYGKQCWYVMC